MTLIFHPRIQNDLLEILDYYDRRSRIAGDRFFDEFNSAVAEIEGFPTRHRSVDSVRRRFNLRRFPYHIIYEIHGQEVRITVLRHHKRRPSYGLRRRWR